MIKVNPDGSFEAATPAEAVEISRLLRGNVAANSPAAAAKPAKSSGAKTPPAPVENGAEIAASVSSWVIPSAIQFLTAIKDAAPPGADRDALMRAMGIGELQAFGGRIAAINKVLERSGFTLSQVYEGIRNPQGKFWKAKPKISEALARMHVLSLL